MFIIQIDPHYNALSLLSFNLNKNQMPYSLIRNFDLYYKDSPDLFLIDLQQSKLQTELINCLHLNLETKLPELNLSLKLFQFDIKLYDKKE